MEDYRSPVFLSRLAIGGLVIMSICRVFFALGGIGMAADSGRSVDLGDGDVLGIWELFIGLIALFFLPTFIFTVVTFLMWLFRVFKNLPALRSDQMDFTPGWAVGWWFIPFANLIKPYQAVRTAWAESDPEVEVHNEFLSSVQSGAPGYMMLWWGLWIVSNVFSNITSRLDGVAKAGEESIIGLISVVESILWIVTAVLAIKIVLEITDRQEQRSTRVGPFAINTPPPPPTFSNLG